MREMKFRAWDISQNKMLMQNKDFAYVGITEESKSFIDLIQKNSIAMHTYPYKNVIVMQYIGVKDKNNKEIYEGDIVTAWSEGYFGTFEIKWREDGGGSPKWLLYPAWHNNEFWAIKASREKDNNVYDKGLEIIGNIFENPELLNKKRS